MEGILAKLKILTKNSDILMAAGLLMVLGVMIIPIPPIVLDIFLAISLASSIVVLLMSVYTKKPLDFSTFPTVLLVLTLFRLSLNVASTRNILLRGGADGSGAAGEIIKAFGDFVVGGNFAVGIIIFLILVVINFIVITKGAGRVAEVAARFTLDAMPGKQMAIDADLNAGIIDDKVARKRRQEVAQEADFYGSMDGASKFVRGDAIAGILITAINIVGGIIVGVAQNDMSFSDASQVFTLLTVGDGLIAQIPALIISTAAGIIITRNANEDSIGEQIENQFTLHPKALYFAGGGLIFFALIPGLPKIPFILTGGSIIWLANWVEKRNTKKEQDEKIKSVETKKATPDNLEELLNVELLELEVGYGLVNIVDANQNGDLLERITQIRKQFVLDWGVIIPSVKIRDNLEIKPGAYVIKIKGIEVAKGELMPDHFLAMDPGTVIEKIDGVETKEPVFGLSAVWINEDLKDDAQYNGYTVVDLSTVLATHLTEILKVNLQELFGRQELVRVIDNFKQAYPKIVSDLIPDILPMGVILKVLQNLLRENVSIRDLRTILESLAEHGTQTKNPEALTEFVRQSLYRTITERIKSAQGDVPLFMLDKTIEDVVSKNMLQTDHGMDVALEPRVLQNILASIHEKTEQATNLGEKMVILCSPQIRGAFRRLTEKYIPNLIVVSHNELSPEANIRSLGNVRL